MVSAMTFPGLTPSTISRAYVLALGSFMGLEDLSRYRTTHSDVNGEGAPVALPLEVLVCRFGTGANSLIATDPKFRRDNSTKRQH